MSAPQVAVGILSADKLNFTLTGIFSTTDLNVVSGQQEVRLSSSGMALEWNGETYTSLEFTPTSYDGDTFELEGVTIGVNFHWQRVENQRFRGSLRLIVENNRLTAINLVDVEDYLVSVISSEMSASSSLPLLKAHAVISRSWLMAQIENRHAPALRRLQETKAIGGEIIRWWDHEDHTAFDVCADDHCQRYQGIYRVTGHVAESAVNDTRGEVLTYDGRLCDTRFSKCCGGVFERFSTCWNDDDPPYLRPLRDNISENTYPDLSSEDNAREWILNNPDAFCNTTDRRILGEILNSYDRENPDFYRWTERIGSEKLRGLITERTGKDLGDITGLHPLARGSSGRIYRLLVTGTKGELTVGKELMIRRMLSETHLRSSAFIVEPMESDSRGIPKGFILHGAGWGHGVGLCQIGAAVMGERGYRYNEILRHYYPGAVITKLY